MIYVNGEFVDYTNEEQCQKREIVKWIGEKIKEIRKDLPLTIEFPESLGTVNASGIKEFPQSRPISVCQNKALFGAQYEIRWSQNPKIEQQGKPPQFFPQRIKKFGSAYGAYNGALVLGDNDAEFAFFVKYISNQKGVDFVIRDEVSSANLFIENAKRKAKVDAILPGLPNSISDDVIMIVAESYGIGDAEIIIKRHGEENGMLIIRTRLYEVITTRSKKEKDIVDEFIGRTTIDEKTRVLSLVYRSISARNIVFEQTKNGNYWKVKTGETICQCTGAHHEDFLASYLMKNKDKMDMLKVSTREKDEGEIDMGDEGEKNDVGELEKLQELYKSNIGALPIAYKKNEAWIKKKLSEHDVEH